MQMLLMAFPINNKKSSLFIQKMVFLSKLKITVIKEIKIKKSSEFFINLKYAYPTSKAVKISIPKILDK